MIAAALAALIDFACLVIAILSVAENSARFFKTILFSHKFCVSMERHFQGHETPALQTCNESYPVEGIAIHRLDPQA